MSCESWSLSTGGLSWVYMTLDSLTVEVQSCCQFSLASIYVRLTLSCFATGDATYTGSNVGLQSLITLIVRGVYSMVVLSVKLTRKICVHLYFMRSLVHCCKCTRSRVHPCTCMRSRVHPCKYMRSHVHSCRCKRSLVHSCKYMRSFVHYCKYMCSFAHSYRNIMSLEHFC